MRNMTGSAATMHGEVIEMAFSQVKEKASALFSEAPFIGSIHSNEEYEQALALVDELIEDYPLYRPLIEMLSASIERWENSAPEFTDFNRRLEHVDPGVATLKSLIEQHGLTMNDFPEIGSKSLVSRVLSGERQLTRQHIRALTRRFNINAELFF